MRIFAKNNSTQLKDDL